MAYLDPPSPAKHQCALQLHKRARPGLSLPLSVLLLSVNSILVGSGERGRPALKRNVYVFRILNKA